MIEEVLAFDQAVETVVAWIAEYGGWQENLLVVTADHETGYLAPPPARAALGAFTGSPLSPIFELDWQSRAHINQLVPFFAAGADLLSELADHIDPLRGPYLDNDEEGNALLRALR